jgi:RNA-binding protein Nova
MSSVQASVIIGKGGGTVAGLRQQTGCLLKLSSTTSRFPGTDKQVFLIGGPADLLPAAIQAVFDVVFESAEDRKHMTLHCVVPSTGVSAIIGKGGENISTLRSSTGCNLSVKSQTVPPCGEQILEITGGLEQCSNALNAVVEAVKTAPDYEALSHVEYDAGFGGPPAVIVQTQGGKGGKAVYGAAPSGRGKGAAAQDPYSGGYSHTPAVASNLPPAVASAETAVSFLIPKASIGAVLGRGGQILADIRRQTQTSASIATDTQEGEDPTVTVRGTVAGGHRCMALILERALVHGAAA